MTGSSLPILLLTLLIPIFVSVPLFSLTADAISGSTDDCKGKPICIDGGDDVDDDDDNGGSCRANGTKDCGDGSYETYTCSPPVTSETRATLTVNSFEDGGDGGGPSECDGVYHSDHDKVVALSTGWYEGGSRCGKMIRIMHNGKSVEAMVVDECDSLHGCDQEHAGQPPCRNNIVDGSPAVWEALGLAQDEGEVSVTWNMA